MTFRQVYAFVAPKEMGKTAEAVLFGCVYNASFSRIICLAMNKDTEPHWAAQSWTGAHQKGPFISQWQLLVVN